MRGLLYLTCVSFLSCAAQQDGARDGGLASPTGLSIDGPASGTYLEQLSLKANVEGDGDFSRAVKWRVVSGGGTLSSNTDFSTIYTAPILASTTTVIIEAVSQADPLLHARINIAIEAAPRPDDLFAGHANGSFRDLRWHYLQGTWPATYVLEHDTTTQPASVRLSADTSQGTIIQLPGVGACFGDSDAGVGITLNENGTVRVPRMDCAYYSGGSVVGQTSVTDGGGTWDYYGRLTLSIETDTYVATTFGGGGESFDHFEFSGLLAP